MKAIRDIAGAYEAAEKKGLQTALATLVSVEGSTYRQQGTRMLIAEDGTFTGSISSGCLEGDALRKAQMAMATKKPLLVCYDSTGEDEGFGLGLGCHGVVKILIEPIKNNDGNNPVQLLKQLVMNRKGGVLATVFSEDAHGDHPGTCMLQLRNGEIFNNLPDSLMAGALADDIEMVAKERFAATHFHTIHRTAYTAFVDYIAPAVSLIIVGAGNDSIPLATFANLCGWDIIVIDGRPRYATVKRFPAAQKVIVARPEKIFSLEKIPSLIDFDENTAVVLMTHNYAYDLAALEQLITGNVSYIGVLGPHKKHERLLGDLREKGIVLDERRRAKIFGPARLDIGAESPEEIALSIIAEIKQTLGGGHGTPHRQKKSRIHDKQMTMAQA